MRVKLAHRVHDAEKACKHRGLLGGFSLDYCHAQQKFQAASRVSIPHHTKQQSQGYEGRLEHRDPPNVCCAAFAGAPGLQHAMEKSLCRVEG